MFFIKLIIGIFVHQLVNLVLLKYRILLDDPNHLKHKKMINNKSDIILSGGLIFLVLFLIYPISNYYLKLYIFLIFLLGLTSDLKLINVPSLRFVFQFLIVSIFVYLLNISINFTDLKYLDLILEFKILSLLFTIICFLVLINGSNFLDGLNSLVLVYYILVLVSLISLVKFYNLDYDLTFIFNITLILSVLLIFNYLNKSFLGDSGAYSISSVIGYIAIDFFRTNENFSVLFIIVVLWYPAFETLFSIIRKSISNYNPIYPDNSHLHHRLFNFVNLKFKNRFNANLTTALMINTFNLLVFFIAILNYKSSIFLSLLLLFNVIIYILLYNKLRYEK